MPVPKNNSQLGLEILYLEKNDCGVSASARDKIPVPKSNIFVIGLKGQRTGSAVLKLQNYQATGPKKWGR